MKFSEESISDLRRAVGLKISQKRYQHTLCVEKMAIKICDFFPSLDKSEISAAALLHDISKEYSEADQLALAKENNITLTADDLATPAALHSVTAQAVIIKEFPSFVTDNVISAVTHHTLGHPQMSLFDSVIFISDYAEESRTYPACIKVRDELLSGLANSSNPEQMLLALRKAIVDALSFTIDAISEKGNHLHITTLKTRDAFMKII